MLLKGLSAAALSLALLGGLAGHAPGPGPDPSPRITPAASTPTGSPASPAVADRDMRKLQGTWRVAIATLGGKPVDMARLTIRVRHDEVTWDGGDGVIRYNVFAVFAKSGTTSRPVLLTETLDPASGTDSQSRQRKVLATETTVEPPHLELRTEAYDPGNRWVRWLYAFEGDRLKLAWLPKRPASLPSGFAARSGEDEVNLLELARVAEEPEPASPVDVGSESDLPRLLGTWEVDSSRTDGKPDRGGDRLRSVSIRSRKILFEETSGALTERFFRLAPGSSPPALFVLDAEGRKTSPWYLYQFRPDGTLRLAAARDLARPTSFDAVVPGHPVTVYALSPDPTDTPLVDPAPSPATTPAATARPTSAVLSPRQAPADAQDDPSRLEGEWTIVEIKVDGEPDFKDGNLLGTVSIHGRELLCKDDSGEVERHVFRPIPGLSPASIRVSWPDSKDVVPECGLYEFRDNRLRLAAAHNESRRPTSFDDFSDGHSLTVYELVRDEAAAPPSKATATAAQGAPEAARPPAPKAAAGERDRLVGTWTILSATVGGKEIGETGGKDELTLSTMKIRPDELELNATTLRYRIDPETNPVRAIRAVPKQGGRAFWMIYERTDFDSGEAKLRLGFHERDKIMPRPTGFDSKEQDFVVLDLVRDRDPDLDAPPVASDRHSARKAPVPPGQDEAAKPAASPTRAEPTGPAVPAPALAEEVGRRFRAEPVVAALEEGLTTAKRRVDQVRATARDPNDPAVRRPTAEVDQIRSRLDDLWKEERPTLVTKARRDLVRDRIEDETARLRLRELAGRVEVPKATAAEKSAPPGGDIQALQGTWEIVASQFKGEDHKGSNMTDLDTVRIAGTAILWLKGKEPRTIEQVETFTVAPGEPATIDLVGHDGQTIRGAKGIYRVDGRTMLLCVDRTGKARPTSFEPKPGTEEYLLILRRKAATGDGAEAMKGLGP